MAVTEVSTRALLNATRSVSIIIEWENALLSESSRTKEMLVRLARQITELAPRLADGIEVLILFDPKRIDLKLIESCIAGAHWPEPGLVRLLPAEDLRYYEFKNFGAHHASRELIVFLDSDVIPEDEWLAAMVQPFEDPDIQVVGGNTYLDVESGRFIDRAFAAFWFFPLRSVQSGLEPADGFFANSLAVRRAIFKKTSFPSGETFRGQCCLMADSLREWGIAIHQQKAARASHPAPNGLGHFFVRGICEGYDAYVRLYVERKVRMYPVRALNVFKQGLQCSVRQAYTRARPLQLGFFGTIGATAVAFAYYSLCYIGAVASWIAPGWVRRNFSM
jgi:glycosyltransferase involved in cell wall biosynthesis